MNNTVKTTLYLTGLTILLLLIGELLGGMQGLIIAFIFAGILNFGMYYYSDKIILKMHGAKQNHNTKINNMVSEIAKKAGIPKPKVYIIHQNTLNAFATGRNPKHAAIALTPLIINTLNDDELKAVIGHELTHIKNYDTLISTLSATIAGTITLLTRIAFYTGTGRNNNNSTSKTIAWIIMLIFTPIIAIIIRLAISRSREFSADEGGAKLSTPKSMISALETISQGPRLRKGMEGASHMYITNPFAANNITELFSTHPSLHKRVQNITRLDK
ncbi:MAG: M48 family metalloprotease [Nanoarchaeota archaeon]|nr:M48 family metalloprotease [Nanoarchaeota archaeon]